MRTDGRWMAAVLLAVLATPAAVGVAAAAEPAPIATRQTGTPPSETPPGARSYAEREAASAPALEKFRGGGAGVYIGGSTVAVVLLVAILLILL